MHKIALMLGTLLLIISLYSCDTTNSQNTNSQTKTLYADGIYEGKGNGYGRALKVSVTVKDGKINDIQIVSHNEVGKQYYKEAFEKIPKAIIDTQNTEVDAISGATMSSNGIKQAVVNALAEAGK